FELPSTQFKSDEPAYLLYKRVIDKARALPDVEEAGLWAPGMPGSSTFIKFIVPEGRSLTAQADKIKVCEDRVWLGMVRRMGIGLLLGRDFTEQDDAHRPLVAMVSRSAAEAILAGAGADRQAVLGGAAAELLGGGGGRRHGRRSARAPGV